MRKFLLSSMLLASLSFAAIPQARAASLAGPTDSSLLTEQFSVDSSTAVPGTVLKPGSYLIRVVDHMSDRSILRIEKADGKVVSTFLGVPNRTLANAGSQGPVKWTGGSDHDKALRGYNFPGSFSVEFVYPKAEAVKIAVAHSAAVEAIDPPSDNLPSKEKQLTNDDMRIVTLWTLSPTRVNGTTGIAAQKYTPTEAAPAPAPVVARNEPPANLPAPRASRAAAAPAPVPAAGNSAAAAKAPVRRRPVAAALPHTGSDLPVVLLTGLIALFGIAVLRGRSLLAQR